DFRRDKKSGKRLGVRSDDEQRVGVHLLRFAELAYSETALVDDLATLHEADGQARHSDRIAAALDHVDDSLHALGIESVCRPPRERLLGVTLGAQALAKQND